jgi:glutaredoxin
MSPRIEIYGRDDCRFCAAAVAHCQKRNYPFAYHDIKTYQYLEVDLHHRLGAKPETVPQIFIGAHHIGGFTDLQASDAVIQQILGGN